MVVKKVLLKGMSACPGKVTGIVRIIRDGPINDEAMMKVLLKVKQGDILVTQMTRPLFVVAMHKASAIITDRGGILCHAAMVSREFKIPCVVGTREATKKLKDGQKVLVDADKGIIYES